LKETLTSFDIAAVLIEINQLAEGAYVNKIYQIDTKKVLLKLRKPNQPKLQLLIEAGKRLNLTSYDHETPKKPSTFCMSLRKHLDNSIIKTIRQHQFERIVTLHLGTRQGEFRLVLELFGGGNIILVNPEGIILQAMTYKRMRDRNIIRNEIFQHPPSIGINPLNLKFQDFLKIKDLGETEIVRALVKFLSISGTYAEEILLRANIDKIVQCNKLTENELIEIFDQLQILLKFIKNGNIEPHIVNDENNEWVDVTPVPLKKYESFFQVSYKDFNKALDDYFAKLTNAEMVEESSGEIQSEVARQKRILKSQMKALESLKEPIVKNKKIGDIIYLHFGDLQSLLQKILQEKKNGKTWDEISSILEEKKKLEISPEIYFHSLETKSQVVYVCVEDQIFSLNLRDSIQSNAETYYLRSKKAEKKIKGAEKKLKETISEIKKAEKQVKLAIKTQSPMVKKRKREWFEKYRWFHSSDDFLVIGGRDATTNEILIKKRMESNDVVFHAEIVGAPFVLIKTEGKIPPEQTIKEAAQLAASYSRAWKETVSAINVYWIHPDQVTKTPPSGQYLQKGSFMIRGTKNFVRGVPLKVAVGVKNIDEQSMIIGGPTTAIAHQTNAFVEVVQGNQKSGKLAKQIRHELSKKVPEDLRRQITAIPLDEIQRFIPLGRGKIK
jgi:predicted ribosome quality control (RQC) complex YloA/Tae2 family protein